MTKAHATFTSKSNLLPGMNPLRLVIVCPRYWPQMGDVEQFAANLASAFLQLGARPLILTARWGAAWPSAIYVREVPVAFLPHAPRGGWSTIRYLRDLSRWLREQQTQWDAVYVLNMRHDAYAALGGLAETKIPVVLRCHTDGPGGDCGWHETARFGERIRRRCQTADAIVASGPPAADELARCGFAPDRIHLIPCGADASSSRSADQRFRARTALADINHDLASAEYAPVVVSVGRLEDPLTYSALLSAWRDIAARWPSARLWLIGDGPARDKLFALIRDQELQHNVVMPGTFEDLSDVFLAADIFLSPQRHGGGQLVLEAMAAGLPVIAAADRQIRDLVEHQASGLLVEPQDRRSWAAALTHLCDNPAAASQMGTCGRKTVEQRFPLRRTAEQHLQLFRQLVADKAQRTGEG